MIATSDLSLACLGFIFDCLGNTLLILPHGFYYLYMNRCGTTVCRKARSVAEVFEVGTQINLRSESWGFCKTVYL